MLSSLFLVLADESGGSVIGGCFATLFLIACWVGIAFGLVKWHQANQAKNPPIAKRLNITNGVFFGKAKNLLIGKQQNADGHVLVVGGAGSGKSSCIAIPTVRDTWKAPALVVDIKGELFEKSKRPRSLVFNPMNTSAMGYDPFYLLHDSTDPVTDIRDIALTLCPLSAEVKDPFWIQASQNILTGHLLYCYREEETFPEALRILQSTSAQALFDVELEDAEARMFLMQYMSLKPETLSGIMAELSNKVMAFATDPHIQATLTKKEIITPKLLEEGYDVFLQLPEHKLEQWRPMISLMVQQFARHFEQRPNEGAMPILFILDEFARLGKMESVVHGLATLRSKHVTIMPIIQSLAQLDAVYGHDQRKVICDNCSYKAILGATDAETQQYFSRLVGTENANFLSYTKGDMPVIKSHRKGDSSLGGDKLIIKPEEFAYLKYIVLLTPYGFMGVEKVPYYATPPLVAQQQPLVQSPTPSYQAGYQARIAPPSPIQQQTAPPERKGVVSSLPPSTSGNGQTPPDQMQQQQRTDTASSSSRYEAAIATLAQYAPQGTPLVALAHQFVEKLPAEKQPGFLAWWQRTHQQEPLAVPPEQQLPLPQRPRITGPLPALDTQQEHKPPVHGFVARDPRQDFTLKKPPKDEQQQEQPTNGFVARDPRQDLLN